MKKILVFLTAGLLALGAAWSYNPPIQGENLFYLSHPELLTGGESVAGGGIESVLPASGTLNPALVGLEERASLDLGYTAMLNSLDEAKGNKKYGQAFGTGILIPTDWANFGAEIQGVFSEFSNMPLGNSLHFKTFAAKQFMEKLYIGVGLGFGYETEIHKDWMLTADVGAIYDFGDVAFLKNLRIGASANNLGKTLGSDRNWQGYPSMFTFRGGAAAELIHAKNFVLGLSVDVTTPLFTNLIIDSGIQMLICDFVQVNSSWEFNAEEVWQGHNSWIPTVGVVFKFNIGMGKSDFVKKHDWTKSELCPSAAWKNVDMDINMISVGAVLRLGQKDKSGPDIELE
ncbi:MAG: hypothetical protein IK094_00395 [Treponema sp.]|nr:hypothetical protein [Treponema sp.]